MEGKTRATVQVLVVVMAIAVLAVAVTQVDGALRRQLESSAEAAELIYLPPTRVLRAVSLGYEHALADVLWFRTISYFGRHYRGDRRYPLLAQMCDAVTDLDPTAEHVYRFGGLILMWEADSVDAGIALLEKGTRDIPASWQLQYMFGFSFYYFKDDLAAAAQRLRAAALLPGAPAFVGQLAAAIYAAREGPSRAIDFLSDVERHSTDDGMRAMLRQRLRELTRSRDIGCVAGCVRRLCGAVPAPPHRPRRTRYDGHACFRSGGAAWRAVCFRSPDGSGAEQPRPSTATAAQQPEP